MHTKERILLEALRLFSQKGYDAVSVEQIADAVGISQSATSHQLRFLKQMAVVGNRRAGKSVYYRLIDDHIQTILSTGLEHSLEPEQPLDDTI